MNEILNLIKTLFTVFALFMFAVFQVFSSQKNKAVLELFFFFVIIFRLQFGDLLPCAFFSFIRSIDRIFSKMENNFSELAIKDVPNDGALPKDKYILFFRYTFKFKKFEH